MENLNDQLRKFVKNVNYLCDQKEHIRKLIEEKNNNQKDDYDGHLQKAKFDIEILKIQIELGNLYLKMTKNPYSFAWSMRQEDQLKNAQQQLHLIENQPRINKRFAQNAVRAALLDPTKTK